MSSVSVPVELDYVSCVQYESPVWFNRMYLTEGALTGGSWEVASWRILTGLHSKYLEILLKVPTTRVSLRLLINFCVGHVYMELKKQVRMPEDRFHRHNLIAFQYALHTATDGRPKTLSKQVFELALIENPFTA